MEDEWIDREGEALHDIKTRVEALPALGTKVSALLCQL